MKKIKRKMLEKKGWKVGTAEEFLGLSLLESRSIELKLALRESLDDAARGTGGNRSARGPQWMVRKPEPPRLSPITFPGAEG
jgi:hypothetical protein